MPTSCVSLLNDFLTSHLLMFSSFMQVKSFPLKLLFQFQKSLLLVVEQLGILLQPNQRSLTYLSQEVTDVLIGLTIQLMFLVPLVDYLEQLQSFVEVMDPLDILMHATRSILMV